MYFFEDLVFGNFPLTQTLTHTGLCSGKGRKALESVRRCWRDVTLDAKTPELARHYEKDFGAVRLPSRESSAAPRYLICDEAAQMIFTDYLEEG